MAVNWMIIQFFQQSILLVLTSHKLVERAFDFWICDTVTIIYHNSFQNQLKIFLEGNLDSFEILEKSFVNLDIDKWCGRKWITKILWAGHFIAFV